MPRPNPRCFIWLSVACLSFGTPSQAATLQVRQDGCGHATTINQALEMIDYNDGSPDLIYIGPGTYDEQLVLKGNAGVDSQPIPPVQELTMEKLEAVYQSHPDPLTLCGIDPQSPPLLLVRDATPEEYGFFPSDLDYFFTGQIIHCGNGVTLDNIEIRHASSWYAINAQASDIVYRDCLFSNGLHQFDAYDWFFSAYENPEITSLLNPEVAADNEYFFENCLIDGESRVDGSLYGTDFGYFHGYRDHPGLIGKDPVGGFTYEGCIVKNWDGTFQWFRGREELTRGLAFNQVQDCFFSNVRSGFRWDGNQGPGVFNRNVVHSSEESWIRIRERSGGRPSEIYIANNIFSGNRDPIGGIRIELGEEDGATISERKVWIVNNTFYDYSSSAIHIDGNYPNASVKIANNIFNGSDEVAQGTAIEIADSPPHVTVRSNLFFHNLQNISGEPDLEEDSSEQDPRFMSTEVHEPVFGETFPNQGFEQDIVYSYGTVSLSAYSEIASVVGQYDVDRSHPRVNDLKFGAQGGDTVKAARPKNDGNGQPSPTSLCDPTATPTPTATFTPTATSTPTETATASNTSVFSNQRSDVNVDGVVNETDLLLLLKDWGRVSGP
ncbi:MAG: right-handed parallel beta-helix repeat-containing protein [Candidatus Omnitrophica bacterium]|nr:right-handed parallel beta-helix repeat-containing protein [Candidatus Omnitrophota bacterium]